MPGATAGEVQSDEYRFWLCQGEHTGGLQLMAGPPWFSVGVGVVMLAGFPTRLDPSALFVVLVGCSVSVS